MPIVKYLRCLPCLMFLLMGTAQANDITFLTHFIRPFAYEENGEWKGFAVEIVEEMMVVVGHPQEFQKYPFVRALAKVQKEPNYALFTVARRPEREKTVKWVGPIVSNRVYFYKRKNASLSIRSLEDARKVKVIGVGRGNADHTYLQSKGFTNLYPTSNQMQSVQMLIVKRIDITPIGEMVMPEMAKQAGIDLNLIERTHLKLYDSVLFLVFSKNVPDEIVEKWQSAFDQIKTSGKYKKIYDNYFQ